MREKWYGPQTRKPLLQELSLLQLRLAGCQRPAPLGAGRQAQAPRGARGTARLALVQREQIVELAIGELA